MILAVAVTETLEFVMSGQRLAKVSRLTSNEQVVFVQNLLLGQLLVLKPTNTL